jgi:general stress protein 26
MNLKTNRDQQRFCELLKQFDTGMLVTQTGKGGLHGRPMVIAQVEDNGDVWFITGTDTPKIDEIRIHDDVQVSFQNRDNQYISLSGRAELQRDPQKISELWQNAFQPWFPQGESDPNLVLIHVRLKRGEYWDTDGQKQLTGAFETVSAR